MTSNYLPYYVLWLQRQQQAAKEQEEKKEQEVSQQIEEAPEEVKEEITEEPQEEFKPVDPIPPAENLPEVAQTYKPKATDCELLYEVGTGDYLACDYARQQNAQANSNLAFMLISCLAIGISLAAIIIVCVNRKVDEDSKHGGYYL